MKSFVNKILRFIVEYLGFIFALALYICFVSRYISPAKIWFLAYFGLLFPYIFMTNLAYSVLWICKCRVKYLVIHLFVLIPNFFLISCFFRPFGSSNYAGGSDRLKILTFNIQGFKIPYQKNTTQKDIADFVNDMNADIVCLQEFYVNDKITEELFAGMLAKYKYHSVFYSVRRPTRSFGIITFSKHPIKRTLEIPFENTANAAMYSDIDVSGKTLRIYNLHFQSIKLNLKRLFSGKQDFSNEIEEVSLRLKTAFIKRAGQVDIVAKHINVSPYPVVICGDFNDTPASYTYNKIKGDRLDTFCETGRGCPSTYRLSSIPSFRIDYILHDKIIRSMSHSVHNTVVCSDHYPVSSIIDISETEGKRPDFHP